MKSAGNYLLQRRPSVKIIVVSSKDKNVDDLYTIVVLDGADVVHSEEVSTIKHRDATVWKLADLYGVVDIEMKHEKAIPKFAEIPSIPVLEESEADVFFEENCELVYGRIIQAVSEGLRFGRESIRLFELSGTNVYITSDKPDWKTGVQQALDYYVSVEQYDDCIKARQLLTKL